MVLIQVVKTPISFIRIKGTGHFFETLSVGSVPYQPHFPFFLPLLENNFLFLWFYLSIFFCDQGICISNRQFVLSSCCFLHYLWKEHQEFRFILLFYFYCELFVALFTGLIIQSDLRLGLVYYYLSLHYNFLSLSTFTWLNLNDSHWFTNVTPRMTPYQWYSTHL